MLYPYAFETLLRQRGIKGDRIAGMIACGILLFFMALRAESVGVDTQYYCNVYRQFADIPWTDVLTAELYGDALRDSFTLNFELGYRLLNKLLSCFFAAPQTIIVVNSILIIGLLYRFVRRDSPMILLSLWLYLTLGIYQTEMNVSRNAIAILICYLAFQWIQQKKLLLFVLCVLLATTVHQTALFFLPTYWLVNYIRLTGRKMVVLVLGFSLVGLNMERIGTFLQQVLPNRYARYFSGEAFSISSILVGAFSLALFLLVYLFLRAEERTKMECQYRIGNWMFILNLCFFGVNLGVEAGARLAALFGPYMICFVPQMLTCIEDPQRKKIAAQWVVVISFVQFAGRLAINNIGGTLPYRFFWN